MRLPENTPVAFLDLISDIERGKIRIPQFQREFVWDIQRSANLIDSIIKGYPIGTFIFWKTEERLRSIRNIGNINLPDPKEGDLIDFVLDGQQRLNSLFASLKGLIIKREDKRTEDYSNMFIDLDAKEDEQIVILDIHDKNEKTYIKINDLLHGSIKFLSSFPEKYQDLLEKYKIRINSYSFSILLIKEASIDIATEVFTRTNVGGKTLTLFEIMVAKIFDNDRNFDLSEKYKELIEILSPRGYETISDATVLQCVSIILSKECTRKAILKLQKEHFIDIWNEVVDSIERTVEYFRNFYRIPVSKLLPYNALIVPFTYFFHLHKDKPTGNKQKYLQDYFWRCSLSSRFSSAVETKLSQDIKRIDLILKDELPQYDWSVDLSEEFIKNNGWFSTSSSYIKAILCIYAYQEPKSFNSDAKVNISNDWLKIASSKNYHHFFPKAYLKKQKVDEFLINHIANITIIDDFLNKKQIGDKSPKLYMTEFIQENDNINKTMKTHLIDIEKGVLDNDYNTFFSERLKAISKELKDRVIERETDKKYQVEAIPYSDDVDEY